jgi:hypothetical protein
MDGEDARLGEVGFSQIEATHGSMSEFKIKVARIERTADGRAAPQFCITFQIERGAISFQMPVRLNVSDYDDTKMVQVARDILNRTLSELPAQTLDWRRGARRRSWAGCQA